MNKLLISFLIVSGSLAAQTVDTVRRTTSGVTPTAAHNGSYAIAASDWGLILTTNTAAAWTVAACGSAGFPANWSVPLNNIGSGSLTLTATTSTFYGGNPANISGSVLTVPANTGAQISCDGANYQVVNGPSAGGGCTSVGAAGTVQIAGSSAGSCTSSPNFSYLKPVLTAPVAPTVVALCGGMPCGGSTTWKYAVMGVTPVGLVMGPATTITNGAASLDATDFNRIGIPAVSGAANCLVYRFVDGGGSFDNYGNGPLDDLSPPYETLFLPCNSSFDDIGYSGDSVTFSDPILDNTTNGTVAANGGVNLAGTGLWSTVAGFGATASGFEGTAIGNQALASALATTALGSYAVATTFGDVAVGAESLATGGNRAIAMGQSSLANGNDTIAVGTGASAVGDNSIAIGRGASATANHTVIGRPGVTTNTQIFGVMQIDGVSFSSLPSSANGSEIYCSDCTVVSAVDDTCAASGSGAWAERINGAWKCRI